MTITKKQIAAKLRQHAANGCFDVCEDDLIEASDMMKQLAAERAKPTFQNRVAPWMQECFGPEISADKLERGDRLLEEVLELLQSGDYPADRVAALTQYVWSREKGEPAQEVGGVMVTLAAYCLAHGLDMHDAGETELARIWTKVEKIRAKQAAKPTGSALPIALEPAPDARCAECDCVNGGADCTWIAQPKDAPVTVSSTEQDLGALAEHFKAKAEKAYADGVKDAAKVAEYEAEYVPLKPGDMTRAILALLTEKDDD